MKNEEAQVSSYQTRLQVGCNQLILLSSNQMIIFLINPLMVWAIKYQKKREKTVTSIQN